MIKQVLSKFQNYIEYINFPTAFIVFFLVGLAAYGNAIVHPFIHDDIVFIKENPYISQWSHLSGIFFPSQNIQSVYPVANVYYRPLLEFIYRLEYQIFKFNPYGFHFINIAIHSLNTFLVYIFNIQLFNKKNVSFWIAILFLVHPIQTEAVACISGISNLVFALFFLLSLVTYIYATGNIGVRKSVVFYVLSLIFFIGSLLSKEQAIILPFIFILYQVCFPWFKKGNLLKLLPFIFVTLAYIGFRKVFLGVNFFDIGQYQGELYLRILAIPKTILMYLGLLIFPHNLHYYRVVDILDVSIFSFIILMMVVIFIIGAIKLSPQDERRKIYFAIGWFIICLIPILNFAPLIVEYSYILTAEHFLYLPLLGFLLFLVILINFLFKSDRQLTVFFLVISFLCLGLTFKQNTYWQGEIPLFERTLQTEKPVGRVYILLAKAYYADGQYDKAINIFKKAAVIMQGYLVNIKAENTKNFYLGMIKGIHFDLAYCYQAKKDLDNALDEYQEALKLDPQDSVIHNNIGTIFLQKEDIDSAIVYFRQAVDINPNNLDALGNLGVCYLRKGDIQKAKAIWEEVLNKNPSHQGVSQNLKMLKKQLLMHP